MWLGKDNVFDEWSVMSIMKQYLLEEFVVISLKTVLFLLHDGIPLRFNTKKGRASSSSVPGD
jgi:hypothetical protein